MTIRLADREQSSDLLQFLRRQGCIAYGLSDCRTLEVIRPQAPAGQEESEVRALLDSWLAEHPGTTAELKP